MNQRGSVVERTVTVASKEMSEIESAALALKQEEEDIRDMCDDLNPNLIYHNQRHQWRRSRMLLGMPETSTEKACEIFLLNLPLI